MLNQCICIASSKYSLLFQYTSMFLFKTISTKKISGDRALWLNLCDSMYLSPAKKTSNTNNATHYVRYGKENVKEYQKQLLHYFSSNENEGVVTIHKRILSLCFDAVNVTACAWC